jgi:hypothetical protein
MVDVVHAPAGVTIDVNWLVRFVNTGFPLFRMKTDTLLATEQTNVLVAMSVAHVVIVDDPPGFPTARAQTE